MCVSLTFFAWWLFVRLEEERESESRTKRAVRVLGLALQPAATRRNLGAKQKMKRRKEVTDGVSNGQEELGIVK